MKEKEAVAASNKALRRSDSVACAGAGRSASAWPCDRALVGCRERSQKVTLRR